MTPVPGRYSPAGAGIDPATFWEPGRVELDALRYESARRIKSPWAAIGMAISHSLCAIPYQVRYRSDTRPEGSPLNLALALVGPPGAGKSSADMAALAAVEYAGYEVPALEPVRSGEGIPGVFAYLGNADSADGNRDRATLYRRHSRAHRIVWDEVGVFGAQASRTGSTLVETVNTAATGGALGGQASKGDGLTLQPGDYRAVIVLNAQPGRASGLVDGHALASGLTARLQWFAATAPDLATAPRPSATRPPVARTCDQWQGVRYVDALPDMNAAHERDARAGLAGVLPAEHGHRTTRGAILAIALANMAGRSHLIADDWRRACALLAHSDSVHESVLDALAAPDPVAEDQERRVRDRLHARMDELREAGWAFHEARRKLSTAQGKLLTQELHEGTFTKW